MNLYSWFKERWAQDGQTAILELGSGREWSYAELDAWTSKLAHALREDWGVKPGDRVAVQAGKSPEALFLYLACLRVGAVYLPLNTAYPLAELEYFLQDATPALFVCDAESRERGEKLCRGVNTRLASLNSDLIHGLESKPADFPTFVAEDGDLAAILYTSGTTGRSKGAMLSHANLRSNAEALSQTWGFTSADRLLHALPIFHVHGLFISLHCALASGATTLWLPKFDAESVLRHLPRATVFMGVPTYYTRLIELPQLDRNVCEPVRLFVSGSAPLRTETFEEFEKRTGHRILERYGMTETGIIASNPLRGERIAGTVGMALPGTEVRVTGPEGMIEVRGPGVFTGYWQRPELTREEFTPDGYFRTGDLGSFTEQGYLQISGRAKDLVISGGFNVYPKELELLLDSLPGVGESAVFGVPHPDFGEAVVAAVTRAPGPAGQSLQPERLIADLRSRVAAFKAPKRVWVLEELPRNTMGKVQKAVLRERYKSAFA